jgi:hypothetical protein
MIKLLPLHKLREETEFIPHAILNVPIWHFAQLTETKPEPGVDDLDQYEGFGAEDENIGRFAIMHYRGYPKDTSTIYLPRQFPDDIDKITQAIDWIVKQFGLPHDVIRWQRKDDPDL